MLIACQDTRHDTKALRWLYSRDAETVAALAGWDIEAFRVFVERLHAKACSDPVKRKHAAKGGRK